MVRPSTELERCDRSEEYVGEAPNYTAAYRPEQKLQAILQLDFNVDDVSRQPRFGEPDDSAARSARSSGAHECGQTVAVGAESDAVGSASRAADD